MRSLTPSRSGRDEIDLTIGFEQDSLHLVWIREEQDDKDKDALPLYVWRSYLQVAGLNRYVRVPYADTVSRETLFFEMQQLLDRTGLWFRAVVATQDKYRKQEQERRVERERAKADRADQHRLEERAHDQMTKAFVGSDDWEGEDLPF